MLFLPTVVNLFGGTLLFFAYKMLDYKTKQRNIGDVLLQLPNGLGYSDMGYQTLLVAVTVALVIIVYILELVISALGYGLFFIAGIIIAYFFFYLYLTTQRKGLYENAVLTSMGALPYPFILGYEQKKKSGSPNTILLIKTRGRFVKVTHLLVVPDEKLREAIAVLEERIPKAVEPK